MGFARGLRISLAHSGGARGEGGGEWEISAKKKTSSMECRAFPGSAGAKPIARQPTHCASP